MIPKTLALILVSVLAGMLSACAEGDEPVPPPSLISPPDEPVSAATVTPERAPALPNATFPPEKPQLPVDEDEPGMQRGAVYLDNIELVVRESYPPQIALMLEGSLPTPCHQLRVKIQEADARGRIEIMVYSLVDPGLICAQVLEPFTESIELTGLKDGEHSVFVNGQKVGEFNYP